MRSLPRKHPGWRKFAPSSFAHEDFILRYIPLSPESFKKPPPLGAEVGAFYGLIVRKKIGCAVVRNRIKRRLRHIMVGLDVYQNGSQLSRDFSPHDGICASIPVAHLYIIIVKTNALANCPYGDLRASVVKGCQEAREKALSAPSGRPGTREKAAPKAPALQ